MVKEYTLSFKFGEVCFMAQYTDCLGEYFMSAGKTNIYSAVLEWNDIRVCVCVGGVYQLDPGV